MYRIIFTEVFTAWKMGIITHTEPLTFVNYGRYKADVSKILKPDMGYFELQRSVKYF